VPCVCRWRSDIRRREGCAARNDDGHPPAQSGSTAWGALSTQHTLNYHAITKTKKPTDDTGLE